MKRKTSKNYTLTALATDDLRAARAWSLRRWGKDLTKVYFADLHRAANALAANHRALRPRGDLAGETGLSLYPAREHYLVYYPVAENHVVIVAVLRQGRDIAAILDKGHYQIQRELKIIMDMLASGEITIPS